MKARTFLPAEHVVATMLEGGGAIVLDLQTTSHFDLNPTGALLWRHLAAGKSAEEAASALAAAFDVDGATARRDTEALIAELLGNALIVQRDEPSAP